jgi:ribonuclease-3
VQAAKGKYRKSYFLFRRFVLCFLFMTASPKIAKCERELAYTFQNPSLLERALTHRSWAHERIKAGREEEVRQLHNEALEFVGDSVLGFAVAEYLFLAHPNATEGELTLMKHRLVSAPVLSEVAEKLHIGDVMRIGRGEEKTGGRRKKAMLADTLEAVIAAIFFDGGYAAARTFVYRILAEQLRQITPKAAVDYKTLLQERLQAQKRQAPRYVVVGTEGPAHNLIFHVEAIWDNGKMRGHGSTIKAAEMMAAQLALETLQSEKKKTDNRPSAHLKSET